MRRRLASVILAPGAAVVAVMLTVSTAFAAPSTWAMSPGGSYSSTLASTTAPLTDTTASQSFTCKAETDAGTFHASASGSPAVLAAVTSSRFGTCTDSLGDTDWSATSSGTWDINGYHYEGADGTGTTCPDTGVTCGTITNVTIKYSGKLLGAACDFTVAGSLGTSSEPGSASDLPVTYNNSTGELFVPSTPTLKVTSVTGCEGIIKVGDAAEFTGTFLISPKQTITGSPAS
jgi:hypothetical protein